MLVAGYPEAWRERYRAEMLALLDDDPPGARALASLVAGALDAHLRPRSPWRSGASAPARLRLSVGAIFAGWIAVSLAGAGFQKTIEERPFMASAARHPLLTVGRDVILAGAALGAIAIAIGGLPLLWQALRRAAAELDLRLAWLLLLPPASLLALLAASVALVRLGPARGSGFPAAWVLAAGLPWLLAVFAFALVCALAPRAALRRLRPAYAALRRAFVAGLALVVAMCMVSAGLLVYTLALLAQAPALAGQPSGPVGASVGTMLATQCALAALASAAALTSAMRARDFARPT
jgi:hypothetical protein